MKRLKREISSHAQRIISRLKRVSSSNSSFEDEVASEAPADASSVSKAACSSSDTPKSVRSTTRSVAIMAKPCSSDDHVMTDDSLRTLRSVGSKVGILYLSRQESREDMTPAQANNGNSTSLPTSSGAEGGQRMTSPSQSSELTSRSLLLGSDESDRLGLNYVDFEPALLVSPENADHLSLTSHHTYESIKAAIISSKEDEDDADDEGGDEDDEDLEVVKENIKSATKDLNATYKREKKSSLKLEKEQRVLEALLQELHASRHHINLIAKHVNALKTEKENVIELLQDTVETFDVYDYERVARQENFELYLKYKGVKTQKDITDVLNAINLQKISLLKLESLLRKKSLDLKRNPPKNSIVALKPLTFHINKNRMLNPNDSKREPTGGRECVVNIVDAPKREPVIVIDGFPTSETLV